MSEGKKVIKVDQDLCIGCGACTSVASDHFDLNDEGKSVVKKQYSEDDKDIIQEAIDGCPVDAIKIIEE